MLYNKLEDIEKHRDEIDRIIYSAVEKFLSKSKKVPNYDEIKYNIDGYIQTATVSFITDDLDYDISHIKKPDGNDILKVNIYDTRLHEPFATEKDIVFSYNLNQILRSLKLKKIDNEL